MKNYLIEHGNQLLFEMHDVMTPEIIQSLPFPPACKNALQKAFENNSFRVISEDEAYIIFESFIEPVTYKDIDIVSIDSFYAAIHNQCSILWFGLPSEQKDKVWNPNR